MERESDEHESELESNNNTNNGRTTKGIRLERGPRNAGTREMGLWTFILHKSNMATENPPYNSRSPTYIRFDHGDHYHIVFTSNPKGTNINKQRYRIINDLTAMDRGCTEGVTMTQQVRNESKFLQYCVVKVYPRTHQLILEPTIN